MSTKEAFQKKLQAQLDEWSAEIDKLKARADNAEADVQLEYYKHIENLRMNQEAAKTKLDGLTRASDESWNDLRAGVEKAWNVLSEALKSATSRFK